MALPPKPAGPDSSGAQPPALPDNFLGQISRRAREAGLSLAGLVLGDDPAVRPVS